MHPPMLPQKGRLLIKDKTQNYIYLNHRLCDDIFLNKVFLEFMSRVCLFRIVGLIFLGILSRLLPHPPNLTAMNAIALFGICSLGSLRLSLFTVFAILLLSDFLLGFYSNMIFIYASLGLIVLMGYWLKTKQTFVRTIVLLIASSCLFFIITNLGVWLFDSMYPKTILGLEMCYVAAIPFFLNNLIGSFLFGMLLRGYLSLANRNWDLQSLHSAFKDMLP